MFRNVGEWEGAEGGNPEIRELEVEGQIGGRDEEKGRGPGSQQQVLPLGCLLVLAPVGENKHVDSEAVRLWGSIKMLLRWYVLDSFVLNMMRYK